MPGKESEATVIPQMRQVFYDVYADFPAANAVAVGDLAYATDLLTLYRSDGTTWQPIATPSPTSVVRKTADQTVNNSVVLVNDTHLLFPIGANEIWHLRFFLRVNTTAVADFQEALTIPVACAGRWFPHYQVINEAADRFLGNFDVTAALQQADAAGATDEFLILEACIVNGVNAGNVQLQWAQRVAEVSNTQVLENSFIIAQRLE